jgi:hypothetical protein
MRPQDKHNPVQTLLLGFGILRRPTSHIPVVVRIRAMDGPNAAFAWSKKLPMRPQDTYIPV